jgi:hypothetical protein
MPVHNLPFPCLKNSVPDITSLREIERNTGNQNEFAYSQRDTARKYTKRLTIESKMFHWFFFECDAQTYGEQYATFKTQQILYRECRAHPKAARAKLFLALRQVGA